MAREHDRPFVQRANNNEVWDFSSPRKINNRRIGVHPMNSPSNPTPMATPPPWIAIVGAIFGGMTLVSLLAYVALAGFFREFVCNAYTILAFAFSLGCALAVAFLGGHAASTGQIGTAAKSNSFAFSASGGIATLIILFVLTNFYPPPNCTRKAETTLHLQNIRVPPPTQERANHPYRFNSDLWRRVTSYPHSSDFGDQHNVEVLVSESGKGLLEIFDGAGRSCWLEILILPSSHSSWFEKDNTYWDGSISDPRKIELSFFSARKGGKQSTNSCFKYNNVKVLARVFVIPSEDKIRFLVNSIDLSDFDPAQMAHLPVGQATGTVASFIPSFLSAYAAERKPSFDELKGSLSSIDPVRRANARQFLGANFEKYSKDALAELFSQQSSSALYVESLLHGLIVGIDQANGRMLTPGKPRKLGVDLPYVKGQEGRIIELTAHRSFDVQKQARRLIQRFPVDSFAGIYEPLLRQAKENCGGADRSKVEEKIYGAVFYYYNRIVQRYYEKREGVSSLKENTAEFKKISDLVYPAANCLPDEQHVDVAVIEYGKAFVFEAYKDIGEARTAAIRFLEVVDKYGQDNYYFHAHIEKMRALADRTS
jgi:hypothetical protein